MSLTPNWQLAFILPTLPVHRIGTVARPLLAHTFGREAMAPSVPGGREELGSGDLSLQNFYTVPPARPWAPALELFGQLRFPTGSQTSQLGANGIDSLGLLTASWPIGRLIPYARFGGTRLAGSPSADLLYAAGLEVEVRPCLRLALDGLGRWTFRERRLQEHTVDIGLTWRPIRSFALHATFQWPRAPSAGPARLERLDPQDRRSLLTGVNPGSEAQRPSAEQPAWLCWTTVAD